MLTTDVLRLWCWHNFVDILQWGKKVVYSAAKILLSPQLFTNHFFGIESFNRQEPAQTYTEWVWCLWKFCVFVCVCERKTDIQREETETKTERGPVSFCNMLFVPTTVCGPFQLRLSLTTNMLEYKILPPTGKKYTFSLKINNCLPKQANLTRWTD